MEINVTKNKAQIIKREPLTSGAINVNRCIFHFSDEYLGLIKEVIFNKTLVTLRNDECYIPANEIMKKGMLKIRVYAYQEVDGNKVLMYSPTPCSIYVLEGSYSTDDINKNIVDTSEGNVTDEDVLKDKIAFAKGKKIVGTYEPTPEPIMQTKNIEITQNGVQIIEADEGYTGLDKVNLTINTPQPSGKVIITDNGTYDVESYQTAEVNVQTSSGIDWSEIGYSDTPQAITDGFNYAKEIYDNWDSSVTSLNGKFFKDTTLLIFPLVDTSNVTNFTNFCSDARHLIYIPLIDTSKATTLQGAFAGVAIIDFPALDTSSCTNFSNTFSNNKSLKHFNAINTSNGENFSNMFKDCEQLQDIEVLNLSSATNLSNMFASCNQLTDYSLNNIMQMCINATSYTGTKTLRQLGIGSSKASHVTQLEKYADFVNAGWTTGY